MYLDEKTINELDNMDAALNDFQDAYNKACFYFGITNIGPRVNELTKNFRELRDLTDQFCGDVRERIETESEEIKERGFSE